MWVYVCVHVYVSAVAACVLRTHEHESLSNDRIPRESFYISSFSVRSPKQTKLFYFFEKYCSKQIVSLALEKFLIVKILACDDTFCYTTFFYYEIILVLVMHRSHDHDNIYAMCCNAIIIHSSIVYSNRFLFYFKSTKIFFFVFSFFFKMLVYCVFWTYILC